MIGDITPRDVFEQLLRAYIETIDQVAESFGHLGIDIAESMQAKARELEEGMRSQYILAVELQQQRQREEGGPDGSN